MTTLLALALLAGAKMPANDPLRRLFVSPPPASRPLVYWYFMEGNMTREGITADLEAMKKAGIGGGIFLEVNIGVPKRPVAYMSPEWQALFTFAVKEADRLGLEIVLGTGPGWCGTGGPWVTPDGAMQHLVASETMVTGPTTFHGALPQPKPRVPFFGLGTLPGGLREQWASYYRDVAVLAVPTPQGDERLKDVDEKALYYRAPFSSAPGTKPRLTPETRPVPLDRTIDSKRAVELTARMASNGELTWDVPPGRWTILRYGRTLTGQTTRPAPDSGLGLESDKFETPGIDAHLSAFVDRLVANLGPDRHPGRGLTRLHFDSWEMSSQNWSAHFRDEFERRRGYDPLPYMPTFEGHIVDSVERSERFLWDVRLTAQELVIANHMGTIRAHGAKAGLPLSVEPYDMNPTADLALGATADQPMGEFWSKGFGFDSEYSCFEAVSIGHTNGKPVIGAESFTSDGPDAWLQHPASMKAQGDWALATGINAIQIHRYQHQPNEDRPGMTMGPYGVHWERTQTWWDMVPAFHAYLARSQALLRQGLPVADVLYLNPEGAPTVFQPPASATVGKLPDRRGYNFDGCDPETLIARASVKRGRIVFPDGMTYRLLVLPRVETMTPRLLAKIESLVQAGAKALGNPPKRSPSLVGYPACDADVRSRGAALWATGKIVRDGGLDTPAGLDGAKWIWSEANAAKDAASGERRFERTFLLPAGRKVASARVSMTADNSFRLVLNGKRVLEGTDFNHVQTTELTLRPGSNTLTVAAVNEGSSTRNPAGLIGRLDVTFADGGTMTIPTDASWGGKELGPWNMAPWSLNEGSFRSELYPDYATTAGILKGMGIVPDVESGDALRYAHRKVGDTDVYFVANRSDKTYVGNPTFRVAGRIAEWWNPLDGTTRPLISGSAGVTRVPMRLEGGESGFVVFRKPFAPVKMGRANFKIVRKIGNVADLNFPVLAPVKTLAGPWNVAFDPKWGGPATVEFPVLVDWRSRPEDGVRHYSGKAVYRTTFDADPGAAVLSLGRVANIASVRLNGRDLGVAWCSPWRVAIPRGTLREKGNVLEITVANLWTNRLVGDAALPEAERFTKVTGVRPIATTPLQPSGLLGPVTLLR